MLSGMKATFGGSAAATLDAYKAQLARTTSAYAEQAEVIAQLRKDLSDRDNVIRVLKLKLLGYETAVSSETEAGTGEKAIVSAAEPIVSERAVPQTESAASHSNLLTQCTVAVYQRDSPFAGAQLRHADGRVAALSEYLNDIASLARSYESSVQASCTAGARLAQTLQGVGLQPWCVVGGGEAIAASWALVGRVLQEVCSLSATAAGSMQHALDASLDAELVSVADRVRGHKKSSDAIGEEAYEALGRLMALKKGASPGDVLTRTNDAINASTKAELARFDAVSAMNSLEARRRVLLLDRACACAHALSAWHRHMAHIVGTLDADVAGWQEMSQSGRKALPGRDTVWRQVRDSLETNLVRATAAPGAMSPAPKGYPGQGHPGAHAVEGNGVEDVGPGSDPSQPGYIMLRLLWQASSPLDRISAATKKACALLQDKLTALDEAEETPPAVADADDSSPPGTAPESADAKPPLVTSPVSGSTGSNATLIAGWLYTNRRSDAEEAVSPPGTGNAAGKRSGTVAGAMGSLWGGWHRRWCFVRSGRLYCVRSSSGSGSAGLAPVLLADLAVCNVREGTDEASESTGMGAGSGAIGVETRQIVGGSDKDKERKPPSRKNSDAEEEGGSITPVPTAAHAHPQPSQGSGITRLAGAVASGLGRAVTSAAGKAMGAGVASGIGGTSSSSSTTSSASDKEKGFAPSPDALPVSYAVAHAFECRTPGRTLVFAAPTLAARKEWVKVLRDAAEAALTAPAPGGSGPSGQGLAQGDRPAVDVDVAGLTQADVDALLHRLAQCSHSREDIDTGLALVRYRNNTCADCSAPSPDWASLNLGIVLCLSCSGVHRGLGVHITKVRSTVLDSWEPGPLLVMLCLGNACARRAYASGAPALRPDAIRQERDGHIRRKYVERAWVLAEEAQPVEMPSQTSVRSSADAQLLTAVQAGNVSDAYLALARGAMPCTDGVPSRTALHVSCTVCPAPLACATLLMQTSGWIADVPDEHGLTPWAALLQAMANTGSTGIGTPSVALTSAPMQALSHSLFTTSLALVLLPKRQRFIACEAVDAIRGALSDGKVEEALAVARDAPQKMLGTGPGTGGVNAPLDVTDAFNPFGPTGPLTGGANVLSARTLPAAAAKASRPDPAPVNRAHLKAVARLEEYGRSSESGDYDEGIESLLGL